jgi:hypothetical protein
MQKMTPSQIAARILEIVETTKWNQCSWFRSREGFNSVFKYPIEEWLDGLDSVDSACGSTACVAGWASLLTAPPGSLVSEMHIHYPGGTSQFANDVGREVLGLSEFDADWLFGSHRSKDEVIRALTAIRDGEEFSRLEFSDEDYYDDEDDDDENEDW